MPRFSYRSWMVAIGFLTLVPAGLAGNWPQWRGPSGDGVSTETGLPVKWDDKSNIVWKCPLPGDGASTPAIWGDSIFLTGMQGEKLFFFKIDKRTGKLEWSKEVGSGTMRRGSIKRSEQTFHNLHNMASPSPTTDGEVVIVHFGNGDLFGFDLAGKQLWQHNLQKEHGNYTIWWGHANSPVLWKDLVISVCMQDTLADLQKEPAPSYVVAHDKKTGAQKWKVMRMTGARQEDGDSYTTPIFRTANGQTEMIIVGANTADAYDPATGKQLWVLKGIQGSRTITGPALAGDMLYLTGGKRGAVLAVKLGGTGPLPDSAIVWNQKQSTPDTPCPVVWKDLVFLVTDDGVAQCLDAKTGEVKWRERLANGNYKSSLLAADGKIYVPNMAGVCTVFAAGPKFEKLGENKLEEGTAASMAVADGRLYLRGKKTLYCLGSKLGSGYLEGITSTEALLMQSLPGSR